jgi:hypothetical protein
MRTLVMCSVVVALAAAIGCKKEERPAGATAGSAGAAGATGSAGSAGSAGATATAGSATAPAGAPSTVEIFINDRSVAKVRPEQIAGWPRLDSLVPEESRRLGTWQKVKLTGAKTEELARPSQSYPDMVPALFPGEGGKPAFGMFDPVEHAKKGKPGLRADDLREVRIELATEGRSGEHQGAGGEGADPMKIVVEIEAPAGKSKLTGEQILALPREPMPGQPDTHGWRLAQLLDAAGIKKFERLVLGDAAAGNSLVIERKDLDAKTGKSVPFIKLNKAGALRVRVMKQVGTGWQTAGELRSLGSIKVAK